MALKAGEWVEVRSKDEILATLDAEGRLNKLPFMPQMFSYCGKRFRVKNSAYKSCDTVSGRYVGITIANTVHLEPRCNGAAFGGCQTGCLIFWNEAWLRPVSSGLAQGSAVEQERPAASNISRFPRAGTCTEADVAAATCRIADDGKPVYSCQATRLLEFSRPVKLWDYRQYLEVYRTGSRSPGQLLRGFVYLAYAYGTGANRARWGRPFRRLYDLCRPLHRGGPFPRRPGRLPEGAVAPRDDLDLAPGEVVRVKSLEEILETVNEKGYNRGLTFDAEMVPYCGKTFRVARRVERFVDERTGRMKTLKTPAVILQGTVCKAKYVGSRMFCSREIHLWWREVWLTRAEPSQASDQEAA